MYLLVPQLISSVIPAHAGDRTGLTGAFWKTEYLINNAIIMPLFCIFLHRKDSKKIKIKITVFILGT